MPPLAEDVITPPPVRIIQMMPRAQNDRDDHRQTGALIAHFRAAYTARGWPRLTLLYRNRQLAETMNE